MSKGSPLVINKDLKGLNTFGISSIAREYVVISRSEEVVHHLNSTFPLFILGGGSNLLLPAVFDCRVLHNCIGGIDIVGREDGRLVVGVGAGVIWHELVTWAVGRDLGGIENLALIPGTVGAAPIQNIGAYGVELKDVFHSLEALDLMDGSLKTFLPSDCQFDYRHSVFKGELKGRFCITRVYFKLTRKEDHEIDTSYQALSKYLSEQNIAGGNIQDVYQAVIDIRQSKLPDPEKLGNSGSFFKNAIVKQSKIDNLLSKYSDLVYYELDDGDFKIPTGWLIEKVGWKGKSLGPAGSYKNQSLVLVNHGGATSNDIRKLAEAIISDVDQEFGIRIEAEVNIL